MMTTMTMTTTKKKKKETSERKATLDSNLLPDLLTSRKVLLGPRGNAQTQLQFNIMRFLTELTSVVFGPAVCTH